MSRGFLIFHFILLIATIGAQNDTFYPWNGANCTTPLGQMGECVPIRQCRVLLSILTSRPLIPEKIKVLRSSQCGDRVDRHDPSVCCPKAVVSGSNGNHDDTDGQAANAPTSPHLRIRNNPNLPSDCGSDKRPELYDMTRFTGPFEFPWMVRLEYSTPTGIAIACGGVLLSQRWVLTAAHCVSERNLPSTWSLDKVRLGEYDTQMASGRPEDPVFVPIEDRIIHESYRPNNRDRWHDIALLRLSRPVRFTSHIKPICLPTKAELTEKLWIAGWDETKNSDYFGVKTKLNISLIDVVACSETYRDVGVNLGIAQLCADGEPGDVFCHGDSGGPLMSSVRSPEGKWTWRVVGVFTLGSVSCSEENWPGVYTKVVDYVPWILGKLRP